MIVRSLEDSEGVLNMLDDIEFMESQMDFVGRIPPIVTESVTHAKIIYDFPWHMLDDIQYMECRMDSLN